MRKIVCDAGRLKGYSAETRVPLVALVWTIQQDELRPLDAVDASWRPMQDSLRFMSSDLFRAIRGQDAKQVASVLREGADPDQPLDESPFCRPLEAIIEDGVQEDAPPKVVLDVVRLLVDHKAEVNFWYDDRKLTPLLASMAFPDRRLAKILLEKGADPNVFDASDIALS